MRFAEVRLQVLEGLFAVRRPDEIFPFAKGLKEWLATVCCPRDKLIQGCDPSRQFLYFFDLLWGFHVKQSLDFSWVGLDATMVDHESQKFDQRNTKGTFRRVKFHFILAENVEYLLQVSDVFFRFQAFD